MATELLEPKESSSVPDDLFSDIPVTKTNVPDDLFSDIPAEKSSVPDDLFSDIPKDEKIVPESNEDLSRSLKPVTPSSVSKIFSEPKDLSVQKGEVRMDHTPMFEPDESKIPEYAKQPGYEPYSQIDPKVPIVALGDLLFPKKPGGTALNPRLGRVAPPGQVDATVPEASAAKEGVTDAMREAANGLLTQENIAYMAATYGVGTAGAVGKTAASIFWTAFMGKQAVEDAPIIAAQLGEQMGLPEEQRDKRKIANLLAKAGIETGLTVAPAMYGAKKAGEFGKGFAQGAESVLEGNVVARPLRTLPTVVVDPVLAETAPQTAQAKARLSIDLAEIVEESKPTEEFLKQAQAESGPVPTVTPITEPITKGPDALQIETANEEVLRKPQSEVGLPQVGKGDTELEKSSEQSTETPAPEAPAQQEIKPEPKPEETDRSKRLKELGLSDTDISDLESGKASVSEVVSRNLKPFDDEIGSGPDHAKAIQEARDQAIRNIESVINDTKKKPDPKWQVTVQNEQVMPDGKTKVPGFVQIDDVTEGNKWSSNPEKLKDQGYDIPEDFSKLPQGKYTFEEAQKLLQEKPSEPTKPEPKPETKPGEFPTYPELPKAAEPGLKGSKNITPEFSKALTEWRDRVTEWLKDKPEDKPIAWTTESGGKLNAVQVLKKNPEGKWTVDTYKKSTGKAGNWLKYGKSKPFETRELALESVASKGPLKFQDEASLGKILTKSVETPPTPEPKKPLVTGNRTKIETVEAAKEQIKEFGKLTTEQFENLDTPEQVGELLQGNRDAIGKLKTEKDLTNFNLKEAKRKKLSPEKIDLLTKKSEWLEKALEKSKETEEQRIKSGKEKPVNPLEYADEDLADYFEKKFGEPPKEPAPGQMGRGPTYDLPTYDGFKAFMKERYADRDMEAMKRAFAEADTDFKVRFAKEFGVGKVDPGLKGWVAHIAVDAPLPPEGPQPKPRPAQPAPPPGGNLPPARPAEPPPPPRSSTPYRKFNITALVQAMRQLGQHPTMNERLVRAYGHMITATGAVELKKRLFWDTDLAERVLGHEFGHFIDLFVEMLGKGKQFGMRIAPLKDWENEVFTKTDLRQDARDLSRDWRGDFQNGDRYRDTAKELVADFLSAMFNNPEWVNQKYPRLHDAFQDFQDSKPDFKAAYREIETWLQGDTMAKELMAQDKEAIKETINEMTVEKQKSKPSALDRLMFETVSIWVRPFQREGKPRQIGSSISEKLETSFMYAAIRSTMWHDDWIKTGQKFLNGVDKDPIQARAHLLSYMKAVRIIGEVRASGQFLKDNPDAARTMLKAVLDLDAGLRSRFGNQLDSAPDSALYDLSAAVFREVHDRGEKFVDKIAKEIDDLNLGIDGDAALMAFNVRGKLLNPGGETPETAQQVLDQLKKDLAPEQHNNLEKAAKELRKLAHSVTKELHDEGAIPDKIWNELIVPNVDNHMSFAVLEYFDGRVRAGVLPQKGTALDVADPVIVSELKAHSGYLWLQRQRQVKLLQQIYGSQPGEMLKKYSDIKRIRKENEHDDISRDVIWVNGKPHVIEFPGDPGKLIEAALGMPDFYKNVQWLHDAAQLTHGLMQIYTSLSPRFLFWRNPIRGVKTGMLKLGIGPIAKQLVGERGKRNLRFARNYAAAAFGAEMLPEVRAMVESEALPPPRVALGSVVDVPHMREQLARGALAAFDAQKVLRNRGPIARRLEANPRTAAAIAALRQNKITGTLIKGARWGRNWTERFFTAYEAFEKIYNHQAAIEQGLSTETAAGVTQRAGIPRPGVSGRYATIGEIAFPFTRVKTQGARATYEFMRDPRFRKGFAKRFAILEALPRIAKVAIGMGVVGGAIKLLLHKDEDENDPVWAEAMKRVSPYKMALDDVWPVAFYDNRTGEYHGIWDFKRGKDVPKHFEAVSIRIPSSEEGNLWGTLLYQAMLSEKHTGKEMGRPGGSFHKNMGEWVSGNLAPQPTPVFSTPEDLWTMIMQERNPQDPFRGQPSANPQLFDAGGSDRAQAIAGYLMNKMGGPGEMAAYVAASLGMMDERARNALSTRLKGDKQPFYQKLPYFDALVSHDNYGEYRAEAGPKLDEKMFQARAKNVMPADVRRVYDFWWRNKDRKDKMDEVDKMRLEIAHEFMTEIWGTLKDNKGNPNPDSFYSKVYHAVGPDGSKHAKETVKRDLEQASQIFVELFNEIGKGGIISKPSPDENKTEKKSEDLRYGTHNVDWPPKKIIKSSLTGFPVSD